MKDITQQHRLDAQLRTPAYESRALNEWSVFLDEAATWADINPLLLDMLPIAQPSGGWDALQGGAEIVVPASTVDVAPGYRGVSWWSTEVEADGKSGLVITFGGVRLLAEVFWDRTRIAVDLEGLTPFEARVPASAAAAGSHRLDLKVTNPGGSDTWDDIRPVEWGLHQFPASHDFGGPWQPVEVEYVTGPRIRDMWIRPSRDLRTALVDVSLESVAPVTARILIAGPAGELVAESDWPLIPGHNHVELVIDSPMLFGPGKPNLYRCGIDLGQGVCKVRDFGFRLLDVVDGRLTLNGESFRMATAISWGYYRRGPVPSEGDVEREAESVLEFGNNTLTAHRRPSTPELQRALERRGILLYQEPGSVGGPLFASCRPDQRENVMRFAAKRLRRLARRDRSSACLVWWNLANEWTAADMAGWPEYVDSALGILRGEDDSRLVTFTSGWGETPMMRPFSSKRDTSWDYHRVYMWPNVWHDAVKVALTASGPPKPMLNIDGESTCFASLGRVRKIVESFESESLKGSAKERWAQWLEVLERGLAEIDPYNLLGGVDGFCEQTGNIQSHAFARLIEAHRRDPSMDGLAINGWHQHHILGTSGIVAPDRSPGIDPAPISRANSPRTLAFSDLARVMECGRTYELGVEVLAGSGRTEQNPDIEVFFGDSKLPAVSPLTVTPSRPGLLPVRAEQGEAIVEDLVLVVEKRRPPDTEIALYDPYSELTGWLSANGVRFREAAANDQGPMLSAIRGGPEGGAGSRHVVFERNRPHGYMPVDLGSAVAGDLPSAPDVPLRGGWIGSWAFSVSQILPSLGPPGVWGAERYSIIPARGIPRIRGTWIAGVCSFPDATIFDLNLPAFGASAWIDGVDGVEVLTSTLPLIERREDPLGAAVLMDLLSWLTGATT